LKIQQNITRIVTRCNKKKDPFTSKLDLNLRKRLVKCYVWRIDLRGAEIWTFWKADWKHLGSFEMWYWRGMEKISWTDLVRNEVLQTVKGNSREGKENPTIKKRKKAN